MSGPDFCQSWRPETDRLSWHLPARGCFPGIESLSSAWYRGLAC